MKVQLDKSETYDADSAISMKYAEVDKHLALLSHYKRHTCNLP